MKNLDTEAAKECEASRFVENFGAEGVKGGEASHFGGKIGCQRRQGTRSVPFRGKFGEPKAPRDAKRPVLLKILGAEGVKEREASHLRRKIGH